MTTTIYLAIKDQDDTRVYGGWTQESSAQAVVDAAQQAGIYAWVEPVMIDKDVNAVIEFDMGL